MARRVVAAGQVVRRAALIGALAGVCSLFAGGCRRSEPPSPEAEAARWRPVLLERADAIRVPPPPDVADTRNEVAELIALQGRRTPQEKESADFWNAGAVLRWNEIARDLVARHRTNAPRASRVYALLSAAQYDTLVATWHHRVAYGRAAPAQTDKALLPSATAGASVYPSDHAAIAAASAEVLSYLYPNDAEQLQRRAADHQAGRLHAGVSHRSDIAAGDALGRGVARRVVAYAREDGSAREVAARAPTGAGRWISATNVQPLTPGWVDVKPWLMPATAKFRAKPPPEYGSAEFTAAVGEVRRIADSRSQEQARLAALWADGPGSYTPPGRWNRIAADLIAQHRLSESDAARVMVLLNMALMDAGIAYLDAQYTYWVIRPAQADPAITMTAPLPNSPSYPSGHAAFSGAGAEVLGHLFPKEKEALVARAEEATLSRMYGGIHYRFDGEAGLAIGREIGRLAVERSRTPGTQ
jgi:membrane-associated phospholipid phosphatase